VQETATEISRREQIGQLREAYPVFRIENAVASAVDDGVLLQFSFTAGPSMRFRPTVYLSGLSADEIARIDHQVARRLIRALAIVEAFSYWKAFCSPVIEVGLAGPEPAEAAWWNEFWPGAMGEFFYRNGIDFTAPGFLDVRADAATAVAAHYESASLSEGDSVPAATKAALVMFSGGKDSLALTFAMQQGDPSAADFFLYNPTASQRRLAQSLAGEGHIFEVRREILPELIALNMAGHPNGHTPYSAYLALAATLIGYLRGSPYVLAGNSRSDDEPNVASYLGRPINHQWTKSRDFESALQDYGRHWLPGAPLYSSPLRPLLELQIIASLSGHIDDYLRTASCNRTKGNGWCQACAKCAWVFLATAALFGHNVAVRKTGGDMFADSSLADLYLAMAGFQGAKPFECTGTEDEVRVAIRAVSDGLNPDDVPALAASLLHPEVAEARSLSALLADWGQDDLVPDDLIGKVHDAVAEYDRS
jgi:UDP-N-acetyl-alpha-D-muramoyl-L-alanyl-L-glutamate epimerase